MDKIPLINHQLSLVTPGPWAASRSGRTIEAVDENGVRRERGQRPAGDMFPMIAQAYSYDDAQFLANSPSHVKYLLDAVAERNGIIDDMSLDGGLRVGQESERREVLNVIFRRWPMLDRYAMETEVIGERGLVREPMPSSRLLADNLRLRELLTRALTTFYPKGADQQDWADRARKELGYG